ncbi:MAG TPA: adenosylcobinamide-GDP ribazoletransferase [Bacillota bacterium]|nr:adenosylcobinamide-GDP ribazoletransferase [Bacillota bacterium]
MKGLWAAVRFLTRLPAPDPGPQPPGQQAPWFPLAGALAGAVAAAAAALAGLLWPAPVQAAAAVAGSLWVTGGLHLDGWMDLADGLGSHLPPAEARRVMRDSRVGAVGAMAGAMALVIRFALVLTLPAPWRWRALIAAAASSRAGMVWAAARGPAPEGEGLGAAFVAAMSWQAAAWTLAVGLTLAVWAAGPAGALALLAAVAAAEILRVRISGLGMTGDCLGAVAEVGEWAALALLAAHWPA